MTWRSDSIEIDLFLLQKIFAASPPAPAPAEPEPPVVNAPGLSDFDSADDEEIGAGDGDKSDTENDTSAINRQPTDGTVVDFDYTKTKEYHELLTEFHQNLLCAIRLQLKNTSALVRRATILLLEFAASTRLDIDELLLSYVSFSCLLNSCTPISLIL